MPFAVEVFFDQNTELHLGHLRASLAQAVAAPDRMGIENIRSHISLALFEQGQVDKIMAVLQNLAVQEAPFELQLTAMKSFPGDEGVLYLEPSASSQLALLQRRCFQMLQGLSEGWNRFYFPPDNLVFHCTLNLGLSPPQIQQSLNLENTLALPIKTSVIGLALVEVMFNEVLGEFALNG